MGVPSPDSEILSRRDDIIAGLKSMLPDECVLDSLTSMRAYDADGLSSYRQTPLAVVLPTNVAQIASVMRWCKHNEVKIVPRGAGTSLSGGATPLADGILLSLAKFNKILDIDYENRCVVTQPGVTNLGITHAVEDAGFYYAPDPSSQIACSIGGNIAENSGGVHCLKYGLTTNNVLGVEIVTMEGEVIRIGGRHLDSGSLDLLGVLTGSEGLLGVVTEVTVRILRKPSTQRAMLVGFESALDAGKAVSDVISAGIIPAGMEMMDNPAIRAAEDFVNVGYPREAAALLIVELDGPSVEVDALLESVERIMRKAGANSVRLSQSEQERIDFWSGRKAAFPAVGRISPDYLCMDGTIPRKALPEMLVKMSSLSQQYGLRVANVFHAGDGNLHPLILFDANIEGDLERAEAFGADILRHCVALGGVLTGEHGVGIEKRDLMGEMFNETDLKQQQRLKCAFDPQHLLNPGKVFPQLHRCAELGRLHVHHGTLPHPDLPRF
ncbi:FAD-linked oxidase C-terminal domain-containing protein [Alphaproteobacteria bacterium]|jgi:glycolate oxidase|nr:FAD-binding protein [Alphaproteobacteria bacterium]MDC0970397.1 FAD-linked oxidase C-terminal domain-containing protein [Alphaproteobacteria bacterium]RCL79231.1 MAG: FAD-binding protein [SAR116 cluster bacterium]